MALNLTRFASAFCAWRNLSTQIGASTATTALSAFCCAISDALPPVTHPPNWKPTKARAAAPPSAPQKIASTFGDNFMEKFMTDPFARLDRDEFQRAPAGCPVGLAICKLENPNAIGSRLNHATLRAYLHKVEDNRHANGTITSHLPAIPVQASTLRERLALGVKHENLDSMGAVVAFEVSGNELGEFPRFLIVRQVFTILLRGGWGFVQTKIIMRPDLTLAARRFHSCGRFCPCAHAFEGFGLGLIAFRHLAQTDRVLQEAELRGEVATNPRLFAVISCPRHRRSCSLMLVSSQVS